MKMSSRSSFLNSLKVAFLGIFTVIKSERNIKIHLSIALLVVLAGFTLGLSQIEWAVIVLLIFTILSAEVFNSATENICNLVKDKLSLGYLETKCARDMSAGAVLLLAIASVIIGLLIFLPKILSI